MELEVNLNDTITVNLSERGARILNEYFNQFDIVKNYKEGDIFKTQLWDLMNIFGPYMVMGFDIPFESCWLKIERNVWNTKSEIK